MNPGLLERRLMSKPKRDDVPVKVDAEVIRQARIVAAFDGLSLAEYLSERLRPLVAADLEERKRSDPPHRKPKKKGGAE
jgi:hypothetical protein